MTDRPILFSTPMVRAILAGTKTQTRRVVKPQPYDDPAVKVRMGNPGVALFGCLADAAVGDEWVCPYGGPGDRLWVRETWRYADWTEEGEPHIEYSADGSRRLIEDFPEEWVDRLTDTWTALSEPSNFDIDGRAADRRWRPSIHMPRWASRITLNITGVRVERLQAISREDALAEGIPSIETPGAWTPPIPDSPNLPAIYCGAFCKLWSSINGAESWDANPWVWVVAFERAEPAADPLQALHDNAQELGAKG